MTHGGKRNGAGRRPVLNSYQQFIVGHYCAVLADRHASDDRWEHHNYDLLTYKKALARHTVAARKAIADSFGPASKRSPSVRALRVALLASNLTIRELGPLPVPRPTSKRPYGASITADACELFNIKANQVKLSRHFFEDLRTSGDEMFQAMTISLLGITPHRSGNALLATDVRQAITYWRGPSMRATLGAIDRLHKDAFQSSSS